MHSISLLFHESNARLLTLLQFTPSPRCFPLHCRHRVMPYDTEAHAGEAVPQSWQRELPGSEWRRCKHAGGKDRSISSMLSLLPSESLLEMELLESRFWGEGGRRMASSSVAACCNKPSCVSTLLLLADFGGWCTGFEGQWRGRREVGDNEGDEGPSQPWEWASVEGGMAVDFFSYCFVPVSVYEGRQWQWLSRQRTNGRSVDLITRQSDHTSEEEKTTPNAKDQKDWTTRRI
mmetsp:Transcript_5663/g.12428  ORF Transcript_5663/g.12428 Transcript_5663/m.12428 type:complete len:233 (+) Transcript_5663:481-1179(+)